eukprot:2275124-Alexandrium_andersonii.AAC.1
MVTRTRRGWKPRSRRGQTEYLCGVRVGVCSCDGWVSGACVFLAGGALGWVGGDACLLMTTRGRASPRRQTPDSAGK